MSEIPDGWISCLLGEYITLKNGFAFKSNDYVKPGEATVPVIRISDLNGQVASDMSAIHVPKSKAINGFEIKCGDLLIAMSGATTGKVGVYSGKEPAYQNQRVGNLKLISEKLGLSAFRNHLIASLSEKILKAAHGGAQPNISGKSIEELLILLPPLNEQERIADKLDRLLAKVDNCRERIDRIPLILKRFRQSVLATAISGELTRDWRDEKELCYEDWQSFVLGDIVDEVRNGISVKPDEKPLGVSILRISSVRPFNVNFDDSRLLSSEAALDIYLLEFDDLLFTRYNGTLEFVGVCARVKKLPSYPVVYPDKVIRVRVDKSLAIAGFIEIVANSPVSRKFIEGLAKTSAGQTGISGKDLKSLSVILPTSPEQKEIVRRVEKLFNFADRLEARYQTARAQIDKLTPALLAKAFRGELVPQDPTDEPAATLLAKIQNT